jgi:ATP-dependent DNA helicase RecG
VTGESGYNLAAILLFGHDETILSCTANYVTDAICRRENLDRYDDRLIVRTNLIDAYDQLMEFIAKHTLDRFHLIDGQSVSLRSKIARELVSNTLVHREYTSAYPAKIIIERDRIVTENWSLPKTPGRIDPNNFVPFPKNPLLAHFFVNIGRADILGSGVRNLFEFTRIYTGGDVPELIDGDVFKTIVPLSLTSGIVSYKQSASDNMSDNLSGKRSVSDNISDYLSDKTPVIGHFNTNASEKKPIIGHSDDSLSDKMSNNTYRSALLTYLEKYSEINSAIAAGLIGRDQKTARRVLLQLIKEGIIIAIGANRNRKYRLTKN